MYKNKNEEIIINITIFDESGEREDLGCLKDISN